MTLHLPTGAQSGRPLIVLSFCHHSKYGWFMQDFDSKWPPFHNSFSYYLYLRHIFSRIFHSENWILESFLANQKKKIFCLVVVSFVKTTWLFEKLWIEIGNWEFVKLCGEQLVNLFTALIYEFSVYNLQVGKHLNTRLLIQNGFTNSQFQICMEF